MGAQAASFVWIAAATGGGVPQRVGQDFAELVATDFEAALAADRTSTSCSTGARLADFSRSAFVVFPDGRVIGPPGVEVPPGLQRFAQLRRRLPRARRAPLPGRDPSRPGSASPPDAGDGERGAADAVDPDARRSGPARRNGVPPFPRRRLPPDELLGGPPPVGAGPPFARRRRWRWRPSASRAAPSSPPCSCRRWSAGAGSSRSWGPGWPSGPRCSSSGEPRWRRCSSSVRARAAAWSRAAARRFGEGDLTARAPASGADEIAAVAHAFNRMADDLAARQAQLVESDRAAASSSPTSRTS